LSTQLSQNPTLAELTQGTVETLPQGSLEAKLKDLDRPLRVKLGFDPTKPDLHLGHAVVLHGLRRFQDAGHQVVIIIGDFTARIGDPTGKEATRPPLSLDEVKANAQTYLDQLGLILDLSKTEVHWNGEWLDRMSFADTVKLAAQATVAQMLARDNFAKRYDRNDPIALHEFLYPLMQGYDSVAIKADLEMGGTDQKFNLLMGRDIQEAYGQSPQVVMMYPILEGTDGVQKMSKSLNNYIGLTDAPEDMYGKVMSIPDSLLSNYYRLASGLPLAEIQPLLAGLQAGTTHPRDAKMRLAKAIVSRYHGEQAGAQSEEAFVRQFQQRQLPEDIPVCPVPEATMPAVPLLVAMGLAATSSEARRLVQQGGVKLHRDSEPETVTDINQPIDVSGAGVIVQVGKRRYGRAVHQA
jgi:tyrosyl-tRNA synthetase